MSALGKGAWRHGATQSAFWRTLVVTVEKALFAAGSMAVRSGRVLALACGPLARGAQQNRAGQTPAPGARAGFAEGSRRWRLAEVAAFLQEKMAIRCGPVSGKNGAQKETGQRDFLYLLLSFVCGLAIRSHAWTVHDGADESRVCRGPSTPVQKRGLTIPH